MLGAVLEYFLNYVFEALRKNGFKRWSRKTIEKLINSFYVDNCCVSVDTEEKLHTFTNEARDIMNQGCFDERGWEYTLDSSEKTTAMVLGILFNKDRDTLAINPNVLQKN